MPEIMVKFSALIMILKSGQYQKFYKNNKKQYVETLHATSLSNVSTSQRSLLLNLAILIIDKRSIYLIMPQL